MRETATAEERSLETEAHASAPAITIRPTSARAARLPRLIRALAVAGTLVAAARPSSTRAAPHPADPPSPAAVALVHAKCTGCHALPAAKSLRNGWPTEHIHINRVALRPEQWELVREYLGAPAAER